MKEIILLKLGEVVLKGLNRHSFEETLLRNIRRRLDGLGAFDVRERQSTIYVSPLHDGADLFAAQERLSKVFGVAALSRACEVEKDMDRLYAMVSESFGAEAADDIFWRNAYRFFSSEDTAL